MANPDETFDPNDLESIDALLDEAELEAVSEEPEENSQAESAIDDMAESVAEESLPEPEEVPETTELEAPADEVDDILDSLDEMVADAESEVVSEELTDSLNEVSDDIEPEVIAVSEPATAQKSEQVKADLVQQNASANEKEVDDFLEKRAAAQASKNSNISVEDMDSIKKLIIIFGSVLSVLVLTGIGIGVWSALAASSAGVDDETITLIESIKVVSEQNGAEIKASEKVTKSVEKKLDAINYQLEQLAADLAEMESSAKEEKADVIDPLGLGTKKSANAKTGQSTVKQQAGAVQANTVVADNPQLMKKVTSVNSKLIKAQRRIDEVNKRIKQLQGQYASMMQSVKLIEKQALIEQAERDEKEKAMAEKEAANSNNRYQYSAPDGGFYDQSVSDSYP